MRWVEANKAADAEMDATYKQVEERAAAARQKADAEQKKKAGQSSSQM